MSKLLRYPKISNLYFITCVTHNRKPILVTYFSLMQTALSRTLRKYRISLPGYVVLSDHFHALVDIGGNHISEIMHMFKLSYTMLLQRRHNYPPGRVWQGRFWDHMIRNQEDYNRHLDYIHYNPVKHGFVTRPFDWQYSSIYRYLEINARDWGVRGKIDFEDNFGE